MEAVELPQSAAQSDALVAAWLDGWKDDAIRDQFRTTLQLSLAEAAGSTETGPLPSLLLAIFTRHVFQPTVSVIDLVSTLSEVVSTKEEGGDTPSTQIGTGRHGTQADSPHTQLASAILDAIWVVEATIETRKEMVNAGLCDRLLGEGRTDATLKSIEEQVKHARAALADIVRQCIVAGVTNAREAGERLDLTLLQAIGLVQDPKSFNAKMVRMNTTRLYKQQKFNLLREENEGYSGLINELILGIGPPTIAVADEGTKRLRVVEQESPKDRNGRAQRVINNTAALIGYFDLDPSRVLDIILDVFSANVVRHWPFFLALLSSTTLGGAGIAIKKDKSGDVDMTDAADESQRFGPMLLDVTGESGQHTCAQLLGFKFAYYLRPDTKRLAPLDNLYLTTAILIREGFVRFVDVYPHLSPDEKGMTKLHEEYKDALSDKAMSAKGNALSSAAPLTQDDEDGGALKSARDGNKKGADSAPHVPPNQIVGLLKALLAIGQVKHALIILARYSWLCGAFPAVADLYARLLSVIIEPVYSSVALSPQAEACAHTAASLQRFRYDVKLQELVPVPSPLCEVTAVAPEPLETTATRFVFFYNAWNTSLPECRASDVLRDFAPLLRILGPYLSRNTILFQKICRIGKVSMRSNNLDEEDKVAWLELVRNILLPALSMTSGNSGLVSEVWVILRQLTYTERYSLYGEWKYALYRRPELRVRQAQVEKEAKGILKRISSDNVKLSGRALAKASHANPTIFFTVALNQVQSYSNLIAPIVECAKYLTHLEYDVFGFNLVDALSNPEKDRTKQDGTSVSQWLQSLAAFTGTLYRRYAMMDCSPVLQYIANQLKENNVKDLVIIRELVLKMAGIEPLQNLSDSQVAALTGGRLLRMEAMMMANAGIATPARLALRKSGARLLLALTQSRMAMPLLILIAQQRQACIHLVPDTEAHLKYLGNLFDTCQEILFQYVEFLHNQLEPQAYSDLIPSMDDLCRRFEMEPAIASHLVRPRLTLQLRAAEARETEERLRQELLASQTKKAAAVAAAATAAAEPSVSASVKQEESGSSPKDAEETGKPVEDGKDEKKATSHDEDDERAMDDVITDETDEKAGQAETTLMIKPEETGPVWSPALFEAYTAAESVLPDNAKSILGIHFYASFWQLGLSDISVPTERYEVEIRALQQMADDNPEGGRKSVPKVRMHALDSIRQLRAELKEQNVAHQATRRRLSVEKNHWFSDSANRIEVVYALLQYCVIPRALLSPTDAVFAARFLRLMHTNGTRNFASLTAFDKIIIEQVPALLFSTTENEARNLARFLQTILADLTAWFVDETRFVTEARGKNLPGFQIKWADRHGGEEIPHDDWLSHDKFRILMRKWHNMLLLTFTECLKSREYMRIRNCIVVMTRVARFFPLWEFHGQPLLACVTTVSAEEERGDLKVLGQGLLATLRKEQKGWIPMAKKNGPAPAKSDVLDTAAKDKEAANTMATNGAGETKKDDVKKEGAAERPLLHSARTASAHKLPTRPGMRDEERSSSAAVLTPPSAPSAEGKSNNSRSSGATASVQAARQAVLDSMREASSGGGGGGMNPPRAPNHDRSTQSASQASGSALRRDEALSGPRVQSDRSRDPSPRISSRSRAPSEEPGSIAKRDRAASHDRELERTGSNAAVVSRRDRDSSLTALHRDDRIDRSIRDRERDDRLARVPDKVGERAYRDDRRDREHGKDRDRDRDRDRRDRERDSGRDRRDRRAGEGDLLTGRNGGAPRQPSAAGRDGMDQSRADGRTARGSDMLDKGNGTNSRTSSDLRDERRGQDDGSGWGKDDHASTPTATAETVAPLPSGLATHSPGPAADTGSPSGTSRKRSLADRLSMALESGGGERQGPMRMPDGPARPSDVGELRARENEPNKRPRTSRADEEDLVPRAPAAGGHEDPQGISIHGQGRGGGGGRQNSQRVAQTSRNSSSQRPGGGGAGYNDSSRSASFGGDQRVPHFPRDRASSGRERQGERDSRRRDRRSGK